MFLVHAGQTRKQKTGLRQNPQYLGKTFAKVNDLRRSRLGAKEADHPVFPINVFCLEAGDIALRAAQVPAAPEEGSHFGIGFSAKYTFS